MITLNRAAVSTFQDTKYFPALDGLRAVSVCLVVCNHEHVPVPGWLRGYVGVDIFFVLSGFLITTLLLREAARMGSINLRAFYIRRFFRIVPVFVATVVLYAGAVYLAHAATKIGQFWAALPWLLGFVREYAPPAAGSILGHAWTLGIEEKFYLAWPVVVLWLLPSRARMFIAFAALGALALGWPGPYARSYGALLIGAVAAAALSNPRLAQQCAKGGFGADVAACAMVVAAYVLVVYDNRFLLVFSSTIAVLITTLVVKGGALRGLLESRPLVYLGKRSYSMYLLHVLVGNAVGLVIPLVLPRNWLVVTAVSVALTTAFAAVMYRVVESPCIRIGRAWAGRISAVSPASSRSHSTATADPRD